MEILNPAFHKVIGGSTSPITPRIFHFGLGKFFMAFCTLRLQEMIGKGQQDRGVIAVLSALGLRISEFRAFSFRMTAVLNYLSIIYHTPRQEIHLVARSAQW